MPQKWNELWQMLPNKVQIGAGWKPPLPLILAVWHEASAIQKMFRLIDHLNYAQENGVLEQVDSFLRGLKEDDWFHLGD